MMSAATMSMTNPLLPAYGGGMTAEQIASLPMFANAGGVSLMEKDKILQGCFGSFRSGEC